MNNRRSILGMTAVAGALVSMAALVGACSGSDSNLGTEGGGGGAAGNGTAGNGNIFPDGGGLDATPDAVFEGCVAVSEKAKNTFQPADIIFAVDNSPSMRDEIEWTRANLNGFSQKIADQGLDPRIVMISCLPGDCDGHPNNYGICVAPPLGKAGGCPEGGPYDDNNPPAYLHIDLRMPSQKALQRFVETHDQWAPVLRTTAVTHFVVISDDGSEWTAQQFKDALASMSPAVKDYHFHGIFSFLGKEAACAIGASEPCCKYAAPDGEGVDYKQLVADTGGVGADLCAQDFTPVFNQFATSVIESAALSCEWVIPPPPNGETLDPNRVNVAFIDAQSSSTLIGRVNGVGECGSVENGWYYDNPTQPTKVLVCPDTCAWIQGKPGAQMDIQFGCATQLAQPK
ncbi:MAG TPA: hypothetical protein PLI95_06580 [Polyangiaceae bacterium]|nr:hypothetical protein [Polyangiaceae bacterium]